LSQQQFTKNEIYFATVDKYPVLAKIGCVIPRRLEVAIDKIPEVIGTIPALPNGLTVNVENIFVAIDSYSSRAEIYEDTRANNGDFFVKVAENKCCCILQSLERPMEWSLMKKDEGLYKRLI
jgi:hypothetical protein